MLCSFGFICSTSLVVGASTVESLIPNLDPYRNNNNYWTIGLCLKHSSISQGASWYRHNILSLLKIYLVAKNILFKDIIFFLGSNLYCLDKNYGGVLIIWDRIFGTFQDFYPDKPITYGLVYQKNTFNPLSLQVIIILLTVCPSALIKHAFFCIRYSFFTI